MGAERRREEPRPRGGPTPELAREIAERIALRDATFAAVCADPRTPSVVALYRWRCDRLDFARVIGNAVDFR